MPDVSIYPEGIDATRTSFSAMVSWIELKTSNSTDPFEDSTQDAYRDFEKSGTTNTAVGIRGQLASYAAAHMDSRWRLHSFTLLICGTHARFMRWDRSAVIVSASFDYKKEPEHLANYLLRLNHASEDVLGIDSTIQPFKEPEGDSFRRHFPGDEDRPLHKVIVPSRDASGQGEAYVILAKPPRRLPSPFGRGTRTARAVLVRDSDKVHFLKDYWRVKCDGLHNEGEIYRLLEAAKVPHIPPFSNGNDMSGDHHTTIGHLYEGKSWDEDGNEQDQKGEATISVYQHYRMTLGVVGKKLTAFRSTREYTGAIADAMEGL